MSSYEDRMEVSFELDRIVDGLEDLRDRHESVGDEVETFIQDVIYEAIQQIEGFRDDYLNR